MILGDKCMKLNYFAITLEKCKEPKSVEPIKNATEYGIAVKVSNKWKVVEYTDKDYYVSPKLNPGDKYRVVICAKINGKWDTRDLDKRSFTITIK